MTRCRNPLDLSVVPRSCRWPCRLSRLLVGGLAVGADGQGEFQPACGVLLRRTWESRKGLSFLKQWRFMACTWPVTPVRSATLPGAEGGR